MSQSVLAAAGFAPSLAPSVVMGRHPGLGAPGGGAVSDTLFGGVLDGLRAHGLTQRCAGVLAGYFASAEQVRRAARFIDEARAANPDLFVLVDPILGDAGANEAGGLFIAESVADAINDTLIARADALTPNVFELAWLTGAATGDLASIEAAAEALRRRARPGARIAVTSVRPQKGDIGVLVQTDSQMGVLARAEQLRIPNGVGDVFAASWLAAMLKGAGATPAAGLAEARVADLIALMQADRASELPVHPRALTRPLAPLRPRRPRATTPAWVLGLDGAKAGWVGVFWDLNGIEAPHARVFANFADALAAPQRAHVIAVDMPIGFADAPDPDGGGRACERLARARLGPRRSAIFSSPLRPALSAHDYDEAQRLNRAAGGPGLSKQSFHLFTRMREIDAAMSPALEGCVHESHPELVFAALTGAPMAENKKSAQGRTDRLAALIAHGLPEALLEPHPFARGRVAPDDLVDAGALALAATRIASGEAIRLPDEPPRDQRGLRMAIFA